MFSYDAFDLRIRSEIPLPELEQRGPSDDSDSDKQTVTIRHEEFTRPDAASDRTWYCEDDCVYLSFDVGELRVRDGTEILFETVPGVDEDALRLILLGPALNSLLCQRLSLVLHASTVSMENGAVAFLGPSGQGKSTMAAACALRGHPVLSDDVAAIEFEGDKPVALPGFSASKLSREASTVLDDTGRIFTSTRAENRSERHHHRVAQTLPTNPIRLKRIYLLEEGDAIEVSEVSPRDRITHVLGNAFAPVQQSKIKTSSDYFLQCSRVVETVPVKRLERPLSFEMLPSVVKRIESDLSIPA